MEIMMILLVKMLRPSESIDSWFNILVLHQNHTKHGLTNYIPEQFLDSFLDLVIWGHEHECLIEPRVSAHDTEAFLVMQPGSSVVTSLCGGEAAKKKVAILYVNDRREMKVEPVELQTVRPFIFDDLILADHGYDYVIGDQQKNMVEEFVEQHVKNLVKKSEKLLTGHPKQPQKPLIRLRVEYVYESQRFNVCRFGHRFHDVVANPDDIILFKKRKSEAKKQTDNFDKNKMNELYEQDNEFKVEDLIEKYFIEIADDDKGQLQVLSLRGLARAVEGFVQKDNKDAIEDIFNFQVNKTASNLEAIDFPDDQLEDVILEYKLKRRNQTAQQKEVDDQAVKRKAEEALVNKMQKNQTCMTPLEDDDLASEDDTENGFEVSSHVSAHSRGRHRVSASTRGSRQRGGARESSRKHPSSPVKGKGRGRSRTLASAGTSILNFTRSSQRSRMTFIGSSDEE